MGEYSGDQEFKYLAKGDGWGWDLNSSVLTLMYLFMQLQEFEEKNKRGGKVKNDLSIQARLTHFLWETLMNQLAEGNPPCSEQL